MFKICKREFEWGGRKFTLETGKIARQADGAVVATYGETSVLATVVGAREANPDVDFFPLTVNYQERSSAAGKIPGGYFKREGRPTEYETLTSRLIDRPIRPLFVEGFRNETQVICTLLSYDLENDPDIVALIAASAALTISGLPFLGPVGAARVGYRDGKFVLNPITSLKQEQQLDLVVSGTQEGVLMVESEAQELSEDTMLQAVMFGHQAYQTVIENIINFAEACAKDAWDLTEPHPERADYQTKINNFAESKLADAYKIIDKQARHQAIDEIKKEAIALFEEESFQKLLFNDVFKSLEKHIVRERILSEGVRIDGRDTKTVRNIETEVSFLPRTHGSALFTRGETQAIVVATLGTGDDEQMIDSLNGMYKENFMLHYNFPPYSVGEVGRTGSPGRREIGHGKLAWRAIHPLLPAKDSFPYTIRVVSEITESNGSSSMATVCGTSLALMDAGVPLESPVAGIAMGLIKEDSRFAVVSDILGDEDHLGDMDFKVAGTKKGITALQMDIKITSITEEIMSIALKQAHEGRLHILGVMNKTLEASRSDVNKNAPRIQTIIIPKDKIRDVIGTGGKVIRDICETTGAKIDIDDDGTLKIAAISEESGAAALKRVQDIITDPELNGVYEGVVAKIAEFGAFVNFLGGKSGLVHISEIAHERIRAVEDVLSVGDHVKVKLIGFEDRGKIRLSIKALLPKPETNEGEKEPHKKKANG